jgi:hypothetical protein
LKDFAFWDINKIVFFFFDHIPFFKECKNFNEKEIPLNMLLYQGIRSDKTSRASFMRIFDLKFCNL